MPKLNIIEPQKNICENQLMTHMQRKMENCLSYMSPEEIKDSIFVVVEEKIWGGVACLFKRELNTIQEDVRELVMTLPLHGHVWECPGVYLEHISENLKSGQNESKEFFQVFYRTLYEGLAEFGRQKKAGFVITRLFPEVYKATKQFGLWPYVVELKPENSPDGLFHGILPLTGSQYKEYQKTWEYHLLSN